MENKETNNVAAEVMENVAETAVVNWKKYKKYGLVVGSIIAGGTVVYVGVKVGLPWAKKKIEDEKAKKVDKKLKASAEIDAVEE